MSQAGERVGECSCLSVHVEQFRILAHINAVATNADGQVALQHNTLLAGIVSSSLQLRVQQELNETGECSLTAPLRIRLQPLLVVSHELLVLLRSANRLAALVKQLVQIFRLHPVDSLIVAVREGIQLLSTAQKLGHTRLGTQRPSRLQVDIVRMKRKSTDNIIRTRIHPLVADGRIVDGQHLNELHTRSHSPIHQAAQVAKVAHTIGMPAAQREHGNHHTSGAPRLFAQAQLVAVEHQHLSVFHFVAHTAVVAFLPLQQRVALFVDHHILIFNRHQPSQRIDGQHPFVLTHILHELIARSTPRAQRRMGTTDSHSLSRLQLRSGHTEHDGASEEGQSQGFHLLVAASVNSSQVGIAVQMVRQRAVAPLVGKHVILRSVEMIDARHLVPLAAQHLSCSILHLIVIDDMRQRMLTTDEGCRFQRPQLAIVGEHHEILLAYRAVLTVKRECHMQAFAP